jgi:hypothetical protein
MGRNNIYPLAHGETPEGQIRKMWVLATQKGLSGDWVERWTDENVEKKWKERTKVEEKWGLT